MLFRAKEKLFEEVIILPTFYAVHYVLNTLSVIRSYGEMGERKEGGKKGRRKRKKRKKDRLVSKYRK